MVLFQIGLNLPHHATLCALVGAKLSLSIETVPSVHRMQVRNGNRIAAQFYAPRAMLKATLKSSSSSNINRRFARVSSGIFVVWEVNVQQRKITLSQDCAFLRIPLAKISGIFALPKCLSSADLKSNSHHFLRQPRQSAHTPGSEALVMADRPFPCIGFVNCKPSANPLDLSGDIDMIALSIHLLPIYG